MNETPVDVMDVLSVQQLAQGARTSPEWVLARIEAGVIEGQPDGASWRFSSATLVRARRLAHLEQCFDADPQLAALTTDLIEEVARLRAMLRMRAD